ncbi:MAG: DNA repair protein RecO [Candidatus Sedimenticola endophacoides]
MATDSLELRAAYILHRRAYSNTSLLIECMTPDQGRLPLIAKGAMGRDSGGLQPFVPLLIRWSGRGEVKSLGAYERGAPPLSLSGERLFCGFYINELLLRLTRREDPQPSLYGLYEATLLQIAGAVSLEGLLRRFELRLLEELGYGLNLLLCDAHGEGCPVRADQWYGFDVESGPVSPAPRDGVRVSGRTLLALDGGGVLDETALREAKGLLRHVLRHYLGERPLKSRELFIRL